MTDDQISEILGSSALKRVLRMALEQGVNFDPEIIKQASENHGPEIAYEFSRVITVFACMTRRENAKREAEKGSPEMEEPFRGLGQVPQGVPQEATA